MPPDVPFSQLVQRASRNLRPASGMPQGQFVPPGLMTEQPSYPGGGGIRAPGMRPGGLPPGFDAALLQEAVQPQLQSDVGRLPAAAQPYPLTPDERELGIEAELRPGMSPYLPHQTQAPSVPWSERTKAMNLSMTPQGMADHFRQLGFEAQVLPHDKYAEHHHPMLSEIVEGEGYNIAIKEPTTGDWHVLDPMSMELSDFTDIISDAAITAGSIVGANVAGAEALLARQGAALTAREAAKKVAMRQGAAAAQKQGLYKTAETAGKLAATPSTFLKERVGGAVAGTVPWEAGRQVAAGLSDMPEEGAGPRIMRGAMELGASAIGETVDPIQGLRALMGARGRSQIRAYEAARGAGATAEDLADMPVPGDYRKVPGEELMGLQDDFERAAAMGVVDEAEEAAADAVPRPINSMGDRSWEHMGSIESAEADMPVRGTVSSVRADDQDPVLGSYVMADDPNNPMKLSPEFKKTVNSWLEGSGRTVEDLTDEEWTYIVGNTRPEQMGTGLGRAVETMDHPVPRQPTSEVGPQIRKMASPDGTGYERVKKALLKKGFADDEATAQAKGVFEGLDRAFFHDEVVALKALGVIDDASYDALKKLDVVGLAENMNSRMVQHFVTEAPLFADREAIRAFTKGGGKKAFAGMTREEFYMWKLGWDDAVREADNWDLDAGLLRSTMEESGEWGELRGETDVEKLFGYIADNAKVREEFEAMDARLIPFEPARLPDVDKLAERGEIPLWGELSESGRTGATGRRKAYVTYKVDAIDFMAREHITEGSPAPDFSTRSIPDMAEFDEGVSPTAPWRESKRAVLEKRADIMGEEPTDTMEALPSELGARTGPMVEGERGLAGERTREGAAEARLETREAEEALVEGGEETLPLGAGTEEIGIGQGNIDRINTAKRPWLVARAEELGVKHKKVNVPELRKDIIDAENARLQGEKMETASQKTVAAAKRLEQRRARTKEAEAEYEKFEKEPLEAHKVEEEAYKEAAEVRDTTATAKYQKLQEIRQKVRPGEGTKAAAKGAAKEAAKTAAPKDYETIHKEINSGESMDSLAERWGRTTLIDALMWPKGRKDSAIEMAASRAGKQHSNIKPTDAFWGKAWFQGHEGLENYVTKRLLKATKGQDQWLSVGQTIRDFKPPSESTAVSLKLAYKYLGGKGNPAFSEPGGADVLYKVITKGRQAVPDDWPLNVHTIDVQNAKVNLTRIKQEITALMKDPRVAKQDVEKLIGGFVKAGKKEGEIILQEGNFERLMKHVRDLALMEKVTDDRLLQVEALKLREKFFDLDYEPGDWRPTSGLFEELDKAYNRPEGITWEYGGAMDRDFPSLIVRNSGEEVTDLYKSAARAIAANLDPGEAWMAGEWVSTALHKMGMQHPNLIIDDVGKKAASEAVINTALRRDGGAMDKHLADIGWKKADQYLKHKLTDADVKFLGLKEADIPANRELPRPEFNRMMHAKSLEDISYVEQLKAWGERGEHLDFIIQRDAAGRVQWKKWENAEVLNRLKYLEYTDERIKEMSDEDAWIRANYGILNDSKFDLELKGKKGHYDPDAMKGADPEPEPAPSGGGKGGGEETVDGDEAAINQALQDAHASFASEATEANAKALLHASITELKFSDAVPDDAGIIGFNKGAVQDGVLATFQHLKDSEKITLKQARSLFGDIWVDSKTANLADHQIGTARVKDIRAKWDQDVDPKGHLQKIWKGDGGKPPEGGPKPGTKEWNDIHGKKSPADQQAEMERWMEENPGEVTDEVRAHMAEVEREVHEARPGRFGAETEARDEGVAYFHPDDMVSHAEATRIRQELQERHKVRIYAVVKGLKGKALNEAQKQQTRMVAFFEPGTESASIGLIATNMGHASLAELKRTYLHALGEVPEGLVLPRYDTIGYVHGQSSAGVAGLKSGDKIYKVNGEAIEDYGDALVKMESLDAKGEKIVIEYVRDPKDGVQKTEAFKLDEAGPTQGPQLSAPQRMARGQMVAADIQTKRALQDVLTLKKGGTIILGKVRGAAPASMVPEARRIPLIYNEKDRPWSDALILSNPILGRPRGEVDGFYWPKDKYGETVEIEWEWNSAGNELVVANHIVMPAATKVRTLEERFGGHKSVVVQTERDLHGTTLTQLLQDIYTPYTTPVTPSEYRNLRAFSFPQLEKLQAKVQGMKRSGETPFRQWVAEQSGESIPDGRDRAVLGFLYSTGMRVTEFSEMPLEDLERTQLKRGLPTDKGGKGKPLGKLAKKYSDQFGPNGPLKIIRDGERGPVTGVEFYNDALEESAVWRNLKEYLDARDWSKVKPDEHGTPIFVNRNNQRLTYGSIYGNDNSIMKKWIAPAGKGKSSIHITPHSFRHSMATHMMEYGASIDMIKELLGHANINKTLGYVHAAQKDGIPWEVAGKWADRQYDVFQGDMPLTRSQYDPPMTTYAGLTERQIIKDAKTGKAMTVDGKVVKSLTLEQVDALLKMPDAVETNTFLKLRNKAILSMFYSTGMRNKELTKMTFGSMADHPQLKTTANRHLQAIAKYVAYVEEKYPKAAAAKTTPLFPSQRSLAISQGDPGKVRGITTNNIRENIFVKYRDSAEARLEGVIPEDVHPHALRHSFATHMMDNTDKIHKLNAWLEGEAPASTGGRGSGPSTETFKSFEGPEGLEEAMSKWNLYRDKLDEGRASQRDEDYLKHLGEEVARLKKEREEAAGTGVWKEEDETGTGTGSADEAVDPDHEGPDFWKEQDTPQLESRLDEEIRTLGYDKETAKDGRTDELVASMKEHKRIIREIRAVLAERRAEASTGKMISPYYKWQEGHEVIEEAFEEEFPTYIWWSGEPRPPEGKSQASTSAGFTKVEMGDFGLKHTLNELNKSGQLTQKQYEAFAKEFGKTAGHKDTEGLEVPFLHPDLEETARNQVIIRVVPKKDVLPIWKRVLETVKTGEMSPDPVKVKAEAAAAAKKAEKEAKRAAKFKTASEKARSLAKESDKADAISKAQDKFDEAREATSKANQAVYDARDAGEKQAVWTKLQEEADRLREIELGFRRELQIAQGYTPAVERKSSILQDLQNIIGEEEGGGTRGGTFGSSLDPGEPGPFKAPYDPTIRQEGESMLDFISRRKTELDAEQQKIDESPAGQLVKRLELLEEDVNAQMAKEAKKVKDKVWREAHPETSEESLRAKARLTLLERRGARAAPEEAQRAAMEQRIDVARHALRSIYSTEESYRVYREGKGPQSMSDRVADIGTGRGQKVGRRVEGRDYDYDQKVNPETLKGLKKEASSFERTIAAQRHMLNVVYGKPGPLKEHILAVDRKLSGADKDIVRDLQSGIEVRLVRMGELVPGTGHKGKAPTDPHRKVHAKQDYILYRMRDDNAWYKINRKDYERASIRGVDPHAALNESSRLEFAEGPQMNRWVAMLHHIDEVQPWVDKDGLPRRTTPRGDAKRTMSVSQRHLGFADIDEGGEIVVEETGKTLTLSNYTRIAPADLEDTQIMQLTRSADPAEPGYNLVEIIGGSQQYGGFGTTGTYAATGLAKKQRTAQRQTIPLDEPTASYISGEKYIRIPQAIKGKASLARRPGAGAYAWYKATPENKALIAAGRRPTSGDISADTLPSIKILEGRMAETGTEPGLVAAVDFEKMLERKMSDLLKDPDEFARVIAERRIQRAEAEGIAPQRPLVMEDEATFMERLKRRKERAGAKALKAEREHDVRAHHEALMHYLPPGEERTRLLKYEGRGMLSIEQRGALFDKLNADWGVLGMDKAPLGYGGPKSSIGDFLAMRLKGRKFITKTKTPKLTPEGEQTLRAWQADQEAHDNFVREIRRLVKEDVESWAPEWAADIRRNIKLGNIGEEELERGTIDFLRKHRAELYTYEPNKHIPGKVLEKIRKTHWKRRPKVALSAPPSEGGSKHKEVVFQWNNQRTEWVDVRSKRSVREAVEHWNLVSENTGANQTGRLKLIDEHLEALIELRDNPRIVPRGAQRLPEVKTPKPLTVMDSTGKGPLDALDYKVERNMYVTVTKYQDGMHEYAVFDSRIKATDYISTKGFSELSPAWSEGMAKEGHQELLSDIVRGYDGAKLTNIMAGAEFITAGEWKLTASRAGRSERGKAAWLKYKINQLNQAVGSIEKQLEPDKRGQPGVYFKKKGTWNYELPDLRRGSALYGGMGKISWLDSDLNVTSVQDMPRMDATGRAIRTIEGGGRQGEELPLLDRIPYHRDITRLGIQYVTFSPTATAHAKDVLKNVKVALKEAQDAHKTLVQAITDDPSTVAKGTSKPGGAAQARRALEKGRGAKAAAKKSKKKRVAREIEGDEPISSSQPGGTFGSSFDISDPKPGDFAGHPQPERGVPPHTTFGLTEETFSLSDKVLRVNSEAADDIANAGGIRDLENSAGDTYKLYDPEIRSASEVVGRDPATGEYIDRGKWVRRISKYKGQIVSDAVRPLLSAQGAEYSPYYRFPQAGNKQPQFTSVEIDQLTGGKTEFSRHAKNGEAVKVVILDSEPGNPANLTADGRVNYSLAEYTAFKDKAIDVLRGEGFEVTPAKWKGEKRIGGERTTVTHNGLIISKEGLLDPDAVDAHLANVFSPKRIREWDQRNAKFYVEGKRILSDEIKPEYRRAFLSWWNSYDTAGNSSHTGRDVGEKFWSAARDFALGARTEGGRKIGVLKTKGGHAAKGVNRVADIDALDSLPDRSEIIRGDDIDIKYQGMDAAGRVDAAAPRPIIAEDGTSIVATPELTDWANLVMTRIGATNTPASRRLIAAMKAVEHPELALKEGDLKRRQVRFYVLWSDQKRNAFKKKLMVELNEALTGFFEQAEGTELQRLIGRAGTWLKKQAQQSRMFTAGGVPGELADATRLLRFAWPGSRLSQLGHFIWKIRIMKRGALSISNVLTKIADEPKRAKARALFMQHPELLNDPLLTDKIRRMLALPPFEDSPNSLLTGSTPKDVTYWATRAATGKGATAHVAGLAADKVSKLGGKGAAPEAVEAAVGGAVGKVSSAVGARAGGLTRRRFGPTRYRDRPVIKEAMQRYQDIMARKKKKKKRELRLPRKLQRSS